MGFIRNFLSTNEHVVQERDGRVWVDVGLADRTADPGDFDLDPDVKSRLVCRKGDKIREVIWTVDPGATQAEKPEPRRKQRKQKSAIDAIQDKAAGIKRDRDKMIDIKNTIDEIIDGGGGGSGSPEHEEWMYPSMMTGLNKGIGHAFMTGMQAKDEDIAQAGLEMVRGMSGMMNVIPMLATAYAKGKGVNVGLFGMDGDLGQPVNQPPQQPAPEQSPMIHDRDDGFDVDTIHDNEYEDADFDDDDDGDVYGDGTYMESESVDIHGLGDDTNDEDESSGDDNNVVVDGTIIEEVESAVTEVDDMDGDDHDTDGNTDGVVDYGVAGNVEPDPDQDDDMSDQHLDLDMEIMDIAEPEDPRITKRGFPRGLVNEDEPCQ